MQGCRTEGYEGCECKDARLKDTKDRGCRLVPILRSLVAPTRGAGGFSGFAHAADPFFKKVEVHLHVLCLCTYLCMHAYKNTHDEMRKDRVHQSGWATMRRVTDTAGNDVNLGSNCGAGGVRTHRLDTRGLKRWPKRIPGSSEPTKGPHFEHLFRDFVRSLGSILLCIFMRPHLLVLGSLL